MTPDAEPGPVQASGQPRPKKRELPRGEVHVFDNWCKGCGLCIEFCPAGVLVLGTDNRPRPIYSENCTACRWCELHCPDFAIFVCDTGDEADADEPSTASTESTTDAGMDVP